MNVVGRQTLERPVTVVAASVPQPTSDRSRRRRCRLAPPPVVGGHGSVGESGDVFAGLGALMLLRLELEPLLGLVATVPCP